MATKDGSSWTLNLGDAYRCSGRTCAKVVYGADGRIGVFSASSSQYMVGDHLNSTIATLNAVGAITGQFEYQPFGASSSANGNQAPQYQFASKEIDRSGLYQFGARYYDPNVGRFISPDPLFGSPDDPQSLNPYSYVLNSPVNFVDPTGLKQMDAGGGGGSWDHDRPGGERSYGSNPEIPRHDTEPIRPEPERSPRSPSPEEPSPEKNPPMGGGRVASDGAPERSGPVHEGGSDRQGSGRPGGAPNFEPLNGHLAPANSAMDGAKLLAAMFVARQRAFRSAVSSIAGGRFDFFLFLGFGTHTPGPVGAAVEDFDLLGWTSAKPYVGHIHAKGFKAKPVAFYKGTEQILSYGGELETMDTTLATGVR